MKINRSSKIFVFFPEKNSESPEVRFLLHFQKAKKVSTKTLMSTKTLSTKTLMDCICKGEGALENLLKLSDSTLTLPLKFGLAFRA